MAYLATPLPHTIGVFYPNTVRGSDNLKTIKKRIPKIPGDYYGYICINYEITKVSTLTFFFHPEEL